MAKRRHKPGTKPRRGSAPRGPNRVSSARSPRPKPGQGGEVSTQVFHIHPPLEGETLAAALRQLAGVSWNQARSLIQSRRVQVHGNLALDPARRLADGDVVHLLPHPQTPPPQAHDVRIRYIDPHLVVVEKPSGMTTVRHPEEKNWPQRRRQLQPTLEECLNRIIAKRERSQRGSGSPRVRPVHRLDRETSGLMVFARTVPAERGLVRQFSQHTMARRYLAIVSGHLGACRIETTLVRDRGDGRRGSGAEDEGKRAVTHVHPLEQLAHHTLVECRLETGRTHQIRIHLSERGHPVCGDKVYRTGKSFGQAIPDSSAAPRLALHATELGFVHPITGENLHFEMPLPKELAALLRRLR